MIKDFEIPYSEELVKFLRFLSKNKNKLIWWAMHSNEQFTEIIHVDVKVGKKEKKK